MAAALRARPQPGGSRPRAGADRPEERALGARRVACRPLDSPALVARAFELKPGEVEPEPFPVGARLRLHRRWPRSRPPRAARAEGGAGQGEGGPRRRRRRWRRRGPGGRRAARARRAGRPREGGGRRSASCARRRPAPGGPRPAAGRPGQRARPWRRRPSPCPRSALSDARARRPAATRCCASSRRSPSTRRPSRRRRRSIVGRAAGAEARQQLFRAYLRAGARALSRSSARPDGAPQRVPGLELAHHARRDPQGRATSWSSTSRASSPPASGDQILRETIDELLAEGWRKILLNLSEVTFMDSAGVGELVAGLRTAASAAGARLKLLNANERVHSTLYIARLLPIFEIYQDEQKRDALRPRSSGRAARPLVVLDQRPRRWDRSRRPSARSSTPGS